MSHLDWQEMVKYMKHPMHGRMPVYSDSEIAYNAKLGWSLEDQEVIETKVEEKQESIEDAYEKKFGRRPHHRMKQESIIAALEE